MLSLMSGGVGLWMRRGGSKDEWVRLGSCIIRYGEDGLLRPRGVDDVRSMHRVSHFYVQISGNASMWLR
jgi:hypothetical protein